MKAGTKKLLVLGSILNLIELPALACPSCVGRSQRGTPAFFDDELYENGGNHEKTTANHNTDSIAYSSELPALPKN